MSRCKCRRKRRLKLKHPTSWPHESFQRETAGVEVKFDALSMDQFLVGELTTIQHGTNEEEVMFRLNLLTRIAMYRLRGYSWPSIKQLYAKVLRDIELGTLA